MKIARNKMLRGEEFPRYFLHIFVKCMKYTRRVPRLCRPGSKPCEISAWFYAE